MATSRVVEHQPLWALPAVGELSWHRPVAVGSDS